MLGLGGCMCGGCCCKGPLVKGGHALGYLGLKGMEGKGGLTANEGGKG